MSVDLLRRAAETLREHAMRFPPAYPTGQPWRVVGTDSESMDGVAACDAHTEGDQDACDSCWVVEAHSEAVADYIALMHPPVALALADWLEAEADATDIIAQRQAVLVAREILRGRS